MVTWTNREDKEVKLELAHFLYGHLVGQLVAWQQGQKAKQDMAGVMYHNCSKQEVACVLAASLKLGH